MRLKYYLRGLGLGIIFAAIVFTVAFALNKDNVSDAEIIERAKKLGMVMKDENKEILFSTEKATESIGSEAVNGTENATEEGENPNNQPEPENKDDKKEESQKKSKAEKEGDSDSDSKYVTIKVRSGEVCREVAEDLQRNGLVKDAEEFRKYMGNNGYAKYIKGGTFKIPRGASFKEIAYILMKK